MRIRLINAIAFLFCLGFAQINFAQNVGINATGASPDNSAMLDIVSPDKGLLIPRMDSTSRKNIVTPAEGLMVFDSTYNSFYFYDGTAWAAIGGGSDNLGNHIATQNLQLNGKWLNDDNNTDVPEGIKINPNGFVGVNVFPQNDFQVGIGKESTLSVMHHYPFFSSDVLPITSWQSFTASNYVYLSEMEVYPGASSSNPGWDYNLYEGEGTSGTLLASGSTNSFIFSFNDILLTKDQRYTVEFVRTGDAKNRWTHINVYGGGALNGGGGDLQFTVRVKSLRTGLSVSSTGVSFEDYTFPLSDGTTNQVLSTNGSGTLSWTNHSTNMLEDADQNTKVQVEKNANEDIIRFDINGQEKWTMQGNRLSNSQPNVLIGSGAGQSVTTGTQLTALGDGALASNTTGFTNTAIGTFSLGSNTTGFFNTSVGASSLPSVTTGSRNLAVGSQSLLNCTDCNSNIGIGHLAGSFMTSGSGNTLIGYEVGRTITTGVHNTMLGRYTGLNAGNISYTTLIGAEAGAAASGSDRMTALGYQAGYNSGAGGVYLGHQAGTSETGTDKLYIDNSNTTTPLIWGDFANDSLKVHGTFNINDAFSFPTADGSNGQVLETNGAGQLTWSSPSGGTTPDLDLASNTLSLSGDPTTVDLSGYLDNTDAQDLSLSGNILSLTNDGTTVDLSSFALGNDDLGNHTSTQNIQLDTFWLSSDGGDEGIRIDNSGKIGFGRAVGTVGVPKFEYFGANSSTAGPHLQVVNSGDDHPLFQQLNWSHDNISMAFDSYYDGNWISSSATSNYNFYKLGAYLQTNYSGGNSQGTAFTWSLGTSLDTLGRFGIGRNPTTNKLEVEGNASKTTAGNWLANSDARLKKNIKPLASTEILEKMLTLNGVTYEWNDTQTGTNRPTGIQYGFTAQNIQEVFPSLVSEDNTGYLQTPYGTYDAMTVEAIRALNDKIEALENLRLKHENEISYLQSVNNDLVSKVSEIDELKESILALEAMVKEIVPSKSAKLAGSTD